MFAYRDSLNTVLPLSVPFSFCFAASIVCTILVAVGQLVCPLLKLIFIIICYTVAYRLFGKDLEVNWKHRNLFVFRI